MVKTEPAFLCARWGRTTKSFEVQYNPTELSLEKGVQLAEITIPGLDAPLQQFVRGQAEKLSIELFFDTTEDGMGSGATSVTTKTDMMYMLTKVESESHAPPIVTFAWSQHFPGDSIAEILARGAEKHLANNEGGQQPTTNQGRHSFTGVVESVKQQFTLFSPEGVPLRATVNLVLREYRTLEEQLSQQLKLSSSDRTHSHVLKRGETLSSVATMIYSRPQEWRRIAEENGINDPRRLTPGTYLTVPAMQ